MESNVYDLDTKRKEKFLKQLEDARAMGRSVLTFNRDNPNGEIAEVIYIDEIGGNKPTGDDAA